MRNVCTLGVSSTVLFFLREINRFLETLLSFCIFEKALFLDPQDSILETRSSNVSSIEARGSSLEVRVSSVNLLLSGTVTWGKRFSMMLQQPLFCTAKSKQPTMVDEHLQQFISKFTKFELTDSSLLYIYLFHTCFTHWKGGTCRNGWMQCNYDCQKRVNVTEHWKIVTTLISNSNWTKCSTI